MVSSRLPCITASGDSQLCLGGMEFRCRKEPERALLVHRSLDLEGNVFWKSDGHLVDELHESLFTVAKWSAEESTLEVDGQEVAKVPLGGHKRPMNIDVDPLISSVTYL